MNGRVNVFLSRRNIPGSSALSSDAGVFLAEPHADVITKPFVVSGSLYHVFKLSLTRAFFFPQVLIIAGCVANPSSLLH